MPKPAKNRAFFVLKIYAVFRHVRKPPGRIRQTGHLRTFFTVQKQRFFAFFEVILLYFLSLTKIQKSSQTSAQNLNFFAKNKPIFPNKNGCRIHPTPTLRGVSIVEPRTPESKPETVEWSIHRFKLHLIQKTCGF